MPVEEQLNTADNCLAQLFRPDLGVFDHNVVLAIWTALPSHNLLVLMRSITFSMQILEEERRAGGKLRGLHHWKAAWWAQTIHALVNTGTPQPRAVSE